MECFLPVDGRNYSRFIDDLFHAFGNRLLVFELRETKNCINEGINNSVIDHIAVAET